MKSVAKKNMVMNNPVLNIDIDEPRWEEVLPDVVNLSEEILREVVSFVKKYTENEIVGVRIPLAVNLMLSNDKTVQKLNLELSWKDSPTNVFSFENIDDPDLILEPENEEYLELGDIIIALETLSKEAEIKKISLKDHFSHLWVHGLLHLLGYDHIDDADAEEMEYLEVLILKNLNIRNPYLDIDNA